MNAKKSSGAKHPSNLAIEQAFEDAGLRYALSEHGYYSTELVQNDGDPPVLMIVENDPDVPEVVCFAYLPASLSKSNRLALVEFAGRANVRLQRGFFDVIEVDEGIRIRCVVALDYEEGTLTPEVVSAMIGYSSNQVFEYSAAFLMVAEGKMKAEAVMGAMTGNGGGAVVNDVKPAESSLPKCSECGKENRAGARFCIDCGNRLGA